MSLLYADQNVEFVTLTLKSKTGGSDLIVSMGFDYYDSGAVYTSSPIVYPVLVSAPIVSRQCSGWVEERDSVTISVYGKAHLDRYGRGLIDLREDYEFFGAILKCYFYAKPSGALATHSESLNCRQALEVTDLAYDDVNGVISLQCRDQWFTDKEFNPSINADIFPNMPDKRRSVSGSVAFGGSAGIVVPAVEIGSTTGSGGPTNTYVSAWVGDRTNINTSGIVKTYARNPWPDLEPTRRAGYVPINCPSDGTVAYSGNATFSPPVTYPASGSWGRDLSLFQRGVLWAPAADQLLTTIGWHLSQSVKRAADLVGASSHRFQSSGQGASRGDDDFSFHFWVYFDAVSPGGDMHLLSQGRPGIGLLEWSVWLTAANRIAFGISTNGTTFAVTHTDTTVTCAAGQWYHVAGYHDAAANTIRIWVNGTAIAATSTGASVMTKREGRLFVGSVAAPRFDGRIMDVHYYTAAKDKSGYYNGGVPTTPDLSDADIDMYFPLSEPSGNRLSLVGSEVMRPRGSIGVAAGDGGFFGTNEEHRILIYDSGVASGTAPGTITPGRLLATAKCSDIIGNEVHFGLDTPIPVFSSRAFFYVLETPTDDKYSYVSYLCNYRTTSGAHNYSRDLSTDQVNFTKIANQELAVSFYVMGQNPASEAVTTTRYGKIHQVTYNARNALVPSGVGFANLRLSGLDIKIGVKPIRDDGSGTYTGTASLDLLAPAEIALFALRDLSLGLNIPSGSVEASTFSSVRAAQRAAGLLAAFAFRQSISVFNFLSECCRQGLMRLYKTREGKYAVNYVPDYYPGGGTLLSEALLGEGLSILSVTDADRGFVVNDFQNGFAVDELAIPDDPALIRRAGSDKYQGLSYVNGTESSGSLSAGLRTLCAASETKYGKRLNDSPLDMYETSAPVETIQRALVQLFSVSPRLLTFRLPRASYLSLDLFTLLEVQAVGIESTNGTTDLAFLSDVNNASISYDEGIPVVPWAGGTVRGEVIGIVEEGPYITVRIRTIG